MNIDPRQRVEKLKRKVSEAKRANPKRKFSEAKRKPDADLQNRVPPGQYLTDKFPVLTHGGTQKVDLATWNFRIFGLVEEEKSWTYDAFMALPQIEITTDFHCVTRWSQLDNTWAGVHISDVMAHVEIKSEAQYVMVHAYGGYTTNLPLADLLDDDVIFAHSHNGAPLTPDHGGPLRLVVPKLYAWKSAKWVNGLELMEKDRRGFWEQAGYHDHGDPWAEERFS